MTVPGAPTQVTAKAWPYTALVFFTPPENNGGAAITSYAVKAVEAGWIHGEGPTSPIMVQGGGKLWGGDKYHFVVTAKNSMGTSPASEASKIAVGPSGGATSLVYSNGVFYWEGDWDFGGRSHYADVTGEPIKSPYDIMFKSEGGAWQPWSPGADFDLTGYTHLQLDLKPTTDGKTWNVWFELAGDKLVGKTVTLPSDTQGSYGAAPVKGQWTTYKIPLKNLNVGPDTRNVHIYKFAVGDGKEIGKNVWYANNVQFIGPAAEPKK